MARPMMPQSILRIEERRTQLERIASSLLLAIEQGQYSTSERLQILAAYQRTEKLIETLGQRQRAEEEAYLLRWSDREE